jgi:hypothetical protein
MAKKPSASSRNPVGMQSATPEDIRNRRKLLDVAARTDVHEAIRQGLDDASHGRTRPAREVFDEIRRHHEIQDHRL